MRGWPVRAWKNIIPVAGRVYVSSILSGNEKCPFCNSDRADKTDEKEVEELMKRVEANDPVAMVFLGYHYEHGLRGLQQDYAKGKELYTRAADLGCSKAHIFSWLSFIMKGEI